MFALLFSITIEAKEIEEVVVVGAYVAEDIQNQPKITF